jgi:hypothetical protein
MARRDHAPPGYSKLEILMTRTNSASGDTVTLHGADVAEAIDRFVKSCHQDINAGRAYTLVTPGGPVAHFDVRCAVTGSLPATLLPGASKGGVTLAAGDRVLIVTVAGGSAGVWVVQTTAIDAVRVTAGTDAGRWYLLDNTGIANINLANYTILAQ